MTGLSSAEAARRLAEHGPNVLQQVARPSPLALLGAQFANVLILILLAAAAVSAAMSHAIEAIAIAAIVLLAVLLGFAQEYRAERALDALREMAAPHATVIRDGRELVIDARELVPGDLLVLRAGDRIAGDARLVGAARLAVQEAALTGESVAAEKRVGAASDAPTPIAERAGAVFAGTSVAAGRGTAEVTATGMQTEFGRVAATLGAVARGRTPLQRSLDRLGRTLAKGALLVVTVIVALGLWRGQPFIEMLVFGVALAVAVVPEALPAVVTVSLALGVQRLARRRALMRQLPAVETLGATSVICTDKTGTLTRDEMTLRELWLDGARVRLSGVGYAPDGALHVVQAETADAVAEDDALRAARELLTAAALAGDAYVDFEDGAWRLHGDPTEGAFCVAAAKAGVDLVAESARAPRTHEFPFSSETRRMTTVHAVDGRQVAFAKGAVEAILAGCRDEWTADGARALTEDRRRAILAVAQRMADDALRVLGVARRVVAAVPAGTANGPTDTGGFDGVQSGMTFLGMAGMIDPPRPEAAAAVAACRRAGIHVVMITGDHPRTALAVAREVGIARGDRVVTGKDLAAWDDARLAEEIETIDVFARVAPADKLRLVTALQARGHIVAMTGDGVNDAPALKQADIGVAMGIGGTDVAREAAAMTLTDDNFATIVEAVEEGRGIFANIKKYLMFLLSSNIGEIGLMVGATLLALPLPLTAVQVLYVNLATDGLPALALAVDPPERDLMARPPRDPRGSIFTRPVLLLVIVGGVWSGLVNLAVFTWARADGHGITAAMTMTFASLVLIQFFKAFSFRSDRNPVWQGVFANRWLLAAIAWELVLLAGIIHWPALHRAFGTTGLSGAEWGVVALAAATILPVLELTKRVIRRRYPLTT